ncbi:MAG: class I SAM-dependent rRNA methyltransferase [Phycisphaerales bacterium]|nr:class I SAM-dependent rRNA methyltransferase [Phycisphaerales bacterium]
MGAPRFRTSRSVEAPPEARSPWVLLRSATQHPFIYQKMVRGADPAARPGDVVHVYDKCGALFGRGLYNPRSQIVVRMLTYSDVEIDDAFWRGRLEQAVALRRELRLDDVTDAYRLVHAEGDGLSGLIVERFADCLVFEIFSLGMHRQVEKLDALLREVLGPPARADRPGPAGPWRTFVRADARVEALEGFRVSSRGEAGPASHERLIIREHGVRYRVDVVAGHKTGFFCDQRDNRQRLAALCRDATVLDLCCYTGGFALCARKLGAAREVTGVDLDENAIAIARENANLNQCRVDFVFADAFAYVRQMLANRRTFDVVILDPPKLVLSRDAYIEGLRKYSDFNALALQVVRPGGLLLTCSCSGLVSPAAFREMVGRAAQRAGRLVQVFDERGAAPDHPVMLNCPESAYLKTLWCRVL